jgi:hypothetical protein
MAACIQPDLHLEKLFAPCSRQTVLQTDRSQSTVSLDGFMREGSWTPSVLEATQAKRGGLIRQPWSYLRLDAYSFLWLCEGA